MLPKISFHVCVLLAFAAWLVTSPAQADGTGCRADKVAPAVGLRITQAEGTDGGGCRIEGVIGKEIGVVLVLPAASRWNGRIVAVGVGGQAGSIPERDLRRMAARGYAAMSNDSGHKASDTHWLLGERERAANYAGLANHRMATIGRAAVAAFYGREASHRFFVGCSGGGRQALTEVQRYPGDFDGVIAGAPGVDTPAMSARRMWEMGQHSRFAALMNNDTWRLVAKAAVDACDAIDGARDGILGDPFRCRFDPAMLLCSSPAGRGCLSAEQVGAVRRIYAPLHDENGRQIDTGLLPGTPVSPVPLPEPFTPGPTYLAVALFGDGVHHDANWDARAFRIADDLPAIDRVMDLHADNANIDPFRAVAGKLILYQGLADPLVSARSTIGYYRSLQRRYGTGVGALARLFLVPGMGHCAGGDVPDRFGAAGSDGTSIDPGHDMLSALEAWVERGRAPEVIIAAQTGPVVRSRPLCAFPAAARFVRGPLNQASSFDCGGKVPTS